MLGRRWAMTSECCIFIVGVIVQITSTTEWAQFAVGRLISGLGIGALSAAVPMVSTANNVNCVGNALKAILSVPSGDRSTADTIRTYVRWMVHFYIHTITDCSSPSVLVV